MITYIVLDFTSHCRSSGVPTFLEYFFSVTAVRESCTTHSNETDQQDEHDHCILGWKLFMELSVDKEDTYHNEPHQVLLVSHYRPHNSENEYEYSQYDKSRRQANINI